MIRFLNDITASVFYTGFIRKGGGTAAAALTCTGLYFLSNEIAFFYIMSALVLLGTLVSDIAERHWGHDSSKIVIDEAAGMAIALFMLDRNLFVYASAFILFRFFDIVKPFPINRSQSVPGGAGVMIDDIISGIFANLLIIIFLWIKNQLL